MSVILEIGDEIANFLIDSLAYGNMIVIVIFQSLYQRYEKDRQAS